MKKETVGYYTIVLAICIIIPMIVNAQSERWIYRYDSPPAGSADDAFSVVYGTDGNIYAAGYSQGTGNNDDFTVISLTSSGSQRWVYKYNGTANGGDQARSVVYGADGNIYATGYTSNALTGSVDFAIISLTSDGTERWVYTWDASHDGGIDDGYDIVYGDDGNIYAAGGSQSIDWPDWGRDPWVTVISLDPNGSERWHWSFDSVPFNSHWGHLYSITYGDDGNIYSTGIKDEGTYLQYNYLTIVSHTPAGVTRWIYTNSRDNSCGRSIVNGENGYVYSGGYTWYGGGVVENFAVVKVSTAGGESWTYEYDSGYSDVCNAIAYGLDGNLYAAGSIGDSLMADDRNFAVISIRPDNSLRWADIYDGPASNYDCANALVYGSDGLIYVAGSLRDTFPFSDRFTVMVYDTAGNRLRRYWYTGSTGPDYARSIICGADSNVYVAGMTIGDSYEFTVISLDTLITGIEENIYDHPIASSRIYSVPSPFKDGIVLKSAGAAYRALTIRLVNSSGNVVYTEFFASLPPVMVLDNKNIRSLPSGVYFLVVSSADKEVLKNKLVKIR